ncbi:MAG: hypothetical protein U0T83_03795 [Bacteriovoracaceae bacterium]
MGKSPNTLMQKIDQFIFTKIDTLKAHTVYLKFSEQITLLDEETKSIVAKIITIFLIIAPTIIIFYLSRSNSSIEKEIESRQTLIALSDKVIKKQINLDKSYQYYLSSSAIPDASAMKNRILRSSGGEGAKIDKITVDNFSVNEDIKSIMKTKAQIGFSEFTILDFTALLTSLKKIDKLKIQ